MDAVSETSFCPFWAYSLTLRETYVSDAFVQTLIIPAAHAVICYLQTIWLFTYSDLKTIVGPKTAFGILSALSGPILTKNASPSLATVLSRIPVVLFWTWINLLPFAIDNQRQPEAIQEDAENKPWRSMPSKRMSQRHARCLVFCLYPAAFVASLKVGGMKQCLALMVLGYWYNDRGGADRNCIIRNLINAFGFICYASGATEVASRTELLDNPFKPVALQWFLIIGAVVFSSVHTQDMYDQAGDSLRGRQSVPLVIGDTPARWTIAIAVAFWSYVCPAFWHLGASCRAVSMVLGAIIVLRTLTKTAVAADKLTFRVWNMWMVMMYLMPLLKRLGW